MKNRDPVKLNALFMVHNLYLTVASAIMLVLFIEQLVPTVWRRGIFFAICDHRGGWTRELVVLYYVCLPAAIPKTFTNWSADELSYQIHRVGRHRLPRAEKETIEYDIVLSRCILSADTFDQLFCTPTTTVLLRSSAIPSLLASPLSHGFPSP